MDNDRGPIRGAHSRFMIAVVRLWIGVAIASPTEARADDAPSDATVAHAVQTPAADAHPAWSRRARWRGARRRGPRWERRFGIDYVRVSSPGGLGLALRYAPVPAFTVDLSAASLLLTAELAASATVYPVNAFFDSFVSPLVRVGYRYERFLPYADHVLGALAPSFHSMTSAAQLSVDGLSFHAIAVEIGISFVTRNGTIVEASAGRIFQVGTSHGSNAREGVVFTGARLPAACVSVGKLFGHRSRPR